MTWLPDADLVQHVSLPLELLGLFLAMLEIFFNGHAKKLEQAIDAAANWLAVDAYKDKSLLSKVEDVYNVVFMVYIFLPVVGVLDPYPKWVLWAFYFSTLDGLYRYFVLYWFKSWRTQLWSRILRGILLLPLLVFFVLVVALFLLLQLIITVFDSIGKGHAIGGIGIALGIFGLLGEIYQVILIDLKGTSLAVMEYWTMVVSLVISLGIIAFFVHRQVKVPAKDEATDSVEVLPIIPMAPTPQGEVMSSPSETGASGVSAT